MIGRKSWIRGGIGKRVICVEGGRMKKRGEVMLGWGRGQKVAG